MLGMISPLGISDVSLQIWAFAAFSLCSHPKLLSLCIFLGCPACLCCGEEPSADFLAPAVGSHTAHKETQLSRDSFSVEKATEQFLWSWMAAGKSQSSLKVEYRAGIVLASSGRVIVMSLGSGRECCRGSDVTEELGQVRIQSWAN